MIDNAPILDGFADLALTPMTIRSTFLLLTRLHYSDIENYGTQRERLKTFVWHRDAKQRTLFIDYDFNFSNKPETLEQRPAIYVGTSDFAFKKSVVDNQKTLTPSRDAEQFFKVAQTTVILRHIAKAPSDALLLGDMTVQFYLGIRKPLQEKMRGNLLGFEVIQMLTSRPFERAPESADQQFMADVVIELLYPASWWTFRESHRIKTVTFDLALQELTI